MSLIRHWGSTPAERAEHYPCDGFVADVDDELFRAVDVAAPAALVYRWLCQLRAAPYSYDLIDNRGRRSPQHLTDGLDDLVVGQRIATIFELVAFEPGESLTLFSDTRAFGKVAITYRARAVTSETSRLVAKVVVGRRTGIVGVAARLVLPAGDLVMMRRQLLNFRRLAERDGRLTPTG